MAEQNRSDEIILSLLSDIEKITDEVQVDLIFKEEMTAICVKLSKVRQELVRADRARTKERAREITFHDLVAHRPQGFRETVRAMVAVAMMVPMLACVNPGMMGSLTAPTLARSSGLVPWVQTYDPDPTEPSDDAPIYFFVEDLGMDLLAEYEENNFGQVI